MFTRRQEFTCTQAEFMSPLYNNKLLLADEALYVVQEDGTRNVYFGDGVKTIAQLRLTNPSISYSAIKALSDAAAGSATTASQQAAIATAKADEAAGLAASVVIHKADTMPHQAKDLQNTKTFRFGLQMSVDGNPQIIFEEVI